MRLSWAAEIAPDLENAPPEDLAASGLAAIAGKLLGLAPFPEAAQRLMSLIWDPDHTSEAVVEVIQSDPTITARVLRLINSGAFGLPRSCESIHRAVVLLGSLQVAQIALAQLALEMFDDTGPLGRRISTHCRTVGLLCRRLAARRPGLRHVDVFTPGMLHDLGKLLMLQVDQGDYAELLREAPEDADVSHQLERARFGYDHAVLASHVMTQWNLPPRLREIIALHHDPEAAASRPDLIESVAVLRMADRLSYALASDPFGETETLENVVACPEAELLELDAYRLVQLWPTLREAIA